MKPLLITLAASSFLILISSFAAATRPVGPPVVRSSKSVGPCMPYAEKCLNCVDCTQCKHCSVKGGKCSVCFKR